MSKKKYYAVKNTNQIFDNWGDCEACVKGMSGAKYKGFSTQEQALAFLNDEVVTNYNSVTYQSETGVSGRICVAEDIDPFTLDLQGVVYAVDGSFNSETGCYGSAFACFENNSLVNEGASFGNKIEFATSRNVAGEIFAFDLAIQDAIQKKLQAITIVCDYEGIFRWSAPTSVKVNNQSCWGHNTKSPIAHHHENILKSAYKNGIQHIDFIWVRGHRGIKANHLVDKLAKQVVGLK